jgi:hypothetical protein
MPLPEDTHAVKSVGDTADNRLDDIEWLRHDWVTQARDMSPT